jgi:hypothetical protein
MLLILAHPHDHTADRFAAFLRADRVPCLRLRSWREAEVTVHAERDGTTRVELLAGGEPVSAVLNRGLPTDWSVSKDEGFRAAELTAAWWTGLAFFPGPVINRPTAAGFTPHLDAGSLAAAVPGLGRRAVVGLPGCEVPEAPAVNVHSLRDGRFLGKLFPDLSLDDQEPCLFTPFDPDRTRRLLVAGERLFDLADNAGRVAPPLRARLEPLLAELRRREATFCRIVVEESDTGLNLLHASPFPAVDQYRRLEEAVHRALREFLS